METESMSDDNNKLLPLEQWHVVLGRYNHGKKIKALTHAVESYKTVRRQIRRTKNLTRPEIFKIKFQTTTLLQQELAFSQPPRISFWVDVDKARAAGKLEELMAAHPQCRVTKDFDGEEVVFVQDRNDFFLQADIDTKRRKPTAGFKDEEEKGRKGKCFREIQHNGSIVRKQSTGASVVSTCSTAPTLSTLGFSTASEQTMLNAQRFRLAVSSTVPLEVEIESACCNWIGEAPKSLEVIKRKTRLVEIFKAYVSYYQTFLMGRNPFRNSPVPGLQEMNEEILVHVTNKLGNSMVEWYGKHPSTCMPGEVNAWNDELGHDLNQSLQEGKCHCAQTWNSCNSLGTFQDSDTVMSDDVGGSPGSLRDWEGLKIGENAFDCSSLPPDIAYVDRERRGGEDLGDAMYSENFPDRAPDEVFLGESFAEIPIGMQVGIEQVECDEDINELCDSSFFDECEPTTLIGAFQVDPFPVEAVPIEASVLVKGHLLRDSREGIGLARSCEAKQPPDGHIQHKKIARPPKQRRSRSLEKTRDNSSRRSKRSKRFWVKSRSPSRCPTIQEQDAQDLSLIANEMELGDFCRRLLLSDPTLTQVRIDGDLARSKAMELEQAMECSLADWCLKPVWDRSTGRTEKPSYVMFQRTVRGSTYFYMNQTLVFACTVHSCCTCIVPVLLYYLYDCRMSQVSNRLLKIMSTR